MEEDFIFILLLLLFVSPFIYIVYDSVVYSAIKPDIRVEIEDFSFPFVNKTRVITATVIVSDLYNSITLSRRSHPVLIDVQRAHGYIEILSPHFTEPVMVLNTFSFNIILRGVSEGVDELTITAYILYRKEEINITIKTATIKLQIPVIERAEQLKPVNIYVYASGQLFSTEFYRRPEVADVYVCREKAAFVRDNLYIVRIPEFIHKCPVEVREPGTRRVIYEAESYAILDTLYIIIPDYRLYTGLLVLAGVLLIPITYFLIKTRARVISVSVRRFLIKTREGFTVILALSSYALVYAQYNQSGPSLQTSFILPIYIILEMTLLIYLKASELIEFVSRLKLPGLIDFIKRGGKGIPIKTTETSLSNLDGTQDHGVKETVQHLNKLLKEMKELLEEIKSIAKQSPFRNTNIHIINSKIDEIYRLLAMPGDIDVNDIKPLINDIFKYADEELRAELEKDETVNQTFQYLSVYDKIKPPQKVELTKRINRLATIIREYYIRKTLESKNSSKETS